MTSERLRPLGRRGLMRGGLALGLLLGLPVAGRASAAERAQAQVSQLMRDLLGIINSGRPEGQIYGEFERLLARYADMPAIAAATLGPPWRGATPQQQQSFVAAYQAYLARRYGRQFHEYQQSSLSIQRVRDAGAAGVLVETRLSRPGRAEIAVDWQVSERSGQPRVVNLIIEGISMLANERAEIGTLLEGQRGSVDGLIQALRARA
jgi:phospholipid transport system substrate-binding protein